MKSWIWQIIRVVLLLVLLFFSFCTVIIGILPILMWSWTLYDAVILFVLLISLPMCIVLLYNMWKDFRNLWRVLGT